MLFEMLIHHTTSECENKKWDKYLLDTFNIRYEMLEEVANILTK